MPQPAAQAQPYNRRSASPRNYRPQYHRRTPSTNDDGTIVQSIESPGMYESQAPSDVPTHQHINSRRMPEDRPFLIDLTSSAEKASQRRPMSQTPPQAPVIELRHTGVRTTNESVGQPRRQLIELSHDTSSDRMAYQAEPSRHQNMLRQDQYMMQPSRHEYTDGPVYANERARPPTHYVRPAERRLVYEPVVEPPHLTKMVRYIAEEPVPAIYSDRNAHAYSANGVDQVHQSSMHSYFPPQESTRRLIVLDTAEPMEGVQRTTSFR